MNNLLLGYVISVLVGIPVTLVWSEFLHAKIQKYRTGEDEGGERVGWIPLLIGVFERMIITTFFIFSVSGTAGFIGAWIAVKSAGGWASWNKGTTYGRATLFVGLLGSAMSISFAFLGNAIATATNSPIIVAVPGNPVVSFKMLIDFAALLIAAVALIFTMRQVGEIHAQLKQASAHTLMGLSNQQNWVLFDRYKSKDLEPFLASWDGLGKIGWSWRVLILNHLNLLFGAYQDHKSRIMENSDFKAWIMKGQYWFENLRSDDSRYSVGREVLKKVLRPEEGYSREFIQWLIKEKIIDLDLVSK